jgi:hypothetical protein
MGVQFNRAMREQEASGLPALMASLGEQFPLNDTWATIMPDITGKPLVCTFHISVEDDPAQVAAFAAAMMERLPGYRDCHCGFCFNSYDDDPRELWDIPEARAYARKLFLDDAGKPRRWVRLLSFHDRDIPSAGYYLPPGPFRDLADSMLYQLGKGNVSPGAWFLSQMALGGDFTSGGRDERGAYRGQSREGDLERVQRMLYGKAGRFSLPPSELFRMKRAKRRRPR